MADLYQILKRQYPFPPLRDDGLFAYFSDKVMFVPMPCFYGQFYIKLDNEDQVCDRVHIFHLEYMSTHDLQFHQVQCMPCSLGVPRPKPYSPWIAEGFATAAEWCNYVFKIRNAPPNSNCWTCPPLPLDAPITLPSLAGAIEQANSVLASIHSFFGLDFVPYVAPEDSAEPEEEEEEEEKEDSAPIVQVSSLQRREPEIDIHWFSMQQMYEMQWEVDGEGTDSDQDMEEEKKEEEEDSN